MTKKSGGKRAALKKTGSKKKVVKERKAKPKKPGESLLINPLLKKWSGLAPSLCR